MSLRQAARLFSPHAFAARSTHLTTSRNTWVSSMCTSTSTPQSSEAADAKRVELEQQKAFMASVVDMLPGVIRGAKIQCASSPAGSAEMVLDVDPEQTVPVMRFLKLHSSSQFKCFIQTTAVDYPERRDRFRVIYNLLSTKFNSRIRVQTYVDEVTPLESATKVFKGADWFEREVWDMFGVFFHSHPDMRRILTDYGFEGHPFRKDFPLSGYVEVRYDDAEKRVVQEPVEIAQEYRSFDYSTPWEVFPEGARPKDAIQIDQPSNDK